MLTPQQDAALQEYCRDMVRLERKVRFAAWCAVVLSGLLMGLTAILADPFAILSTLGICGFLLFIARTDFRMADEIRQQRRVSMAHFERHAAWWNGARDADKDAE